MGFLAPWFLAGILAVGLPLWLHLLRQHRRTPQPFSSLMFFERRIQSSTKHRRLRYLVLLCLRMLLLLLIALAFANPYVYRQVPLVSGRTLDVIAIDRSFSMRAGDRLARAKAEAHGILSALGQNQAAQVLAVDAKVENLTEPTTDRGVLSAAIDSVQPTSQVSSYGEFARVLRVLRQTSQTRFQVHFISDMQQTSMPPSFADLDLGAGVALTLHAIESKEAANWAVESVSAPAHVYDPKLTRVVTTIAGWQTAAASEKVTLLVDGKTVAAKDVTVPANGRAEAEFVAFDVPYGMHRGEVHIAPKDALAADDVFRFAMERSDPRRVLFLYSGGRVRASFYYRAAMDSATETGLIVQPAPVEQARGEDLSKYAFVVLEDIGQLDPGLEKSLTDYVRKGGALLITVGPTTMRTGKTPVTGLHFTEVKETQGATATDGDHPALRGSGKLDVVQFFDTARFTQVSRARVLAKLADGSPLLFEEDLGEGRILTFASAFDNATNDFPLHTSFVPFVAQTGRFLAGAEDTPSSSIVGAAAELRRVHEQGVSADVIGPAGKHELSLNEASTASAFQLEDEGFYEVQRADGRRVLIAANADRRESDLTPVAEETLTLWRNTGSQSRAAAKAAGGQEENRPWSFWRYVLIVGLLAAMVESIFATRYLKSTADA